MPAPNPEALKFLLTRRSRPAKTLSGPYPDRAALTPLLTAAARTPDHGKLEPWRFVILTGAALTRLAGVVRTRGATLGKDTDAIAKMEIEFTRAGCVVAVIEVHKPSEKIPALEQTYSAGAVCLSLLNASLASGWGANWLSGWAAHDRGFMTEGLALAPNERIAGLVHIGTEKSAPPERPRPDMDAIVDWVDA